MSIIKIFGAQLNTTVEMYSRVPLHGHRQTGSLGVVLLAVDLAVAQEAGRVAVELHGAHAAAQAGGVPRAAAHFQQEAVGDGLAARAARAVLRLEQYFSFNTETWLCYGNIYEVDLQLRKLLLLLDLPILFIYPTS